MYSYTSWDKNGQREVDLYITMMCKDPVSFTVGVQGATAQLSLEAYLVAGAVNMKEAVFVRT